jgi:ABC-type uncharacterized transport system substrate-binding protein
MVLYPNRNPVFDGFRAQLRKLGYVEGRDLRLDFRTADGDVYRLSSLAQELVRDGADAIVAESPAAAVAAQRATRPLLSCSTEARANQASTSNWTSRIMIE